MALLAPTSSHDYPNIKSHSILTTSAPSLRALNGERNSGVVGASNTVQSTLISKTHWPKEEFSSHLEQKHNSVRGGVDILSSSNHPIRDMMVNGTCLLDYNPTLHGNPVSQEKDCTKIMASIGPDIHSSVSKSSVFQSSVLASPIIDDGHTDFSVQGSIGDKITTIDQMDTDSAPNVYESSNAASTFNSLSNSSKLIPGSGKTIEGTASCVNKNMRVKSQQDITRSVDTLENDDSHGIHVTKSKVYVEPENSKDNVLLDDFTIANAAEDDMNDVKVCDICGDVGYEEVLVVCSDCNEGAEHIYCMQTLLDAVPEGDWFCDDCKSKINEKLQRDAVIDSPTLSSKQGIEKQVIQENNALKVSSSGKSKLCSDKMESKKSAQNSVVPCKRQIGDSNEGPSNKKQVIECDNVPVNASQPLLQRNSSFKAQETIRVDSCGALPEIKIPVSTPYTRDGSLKMSGAVKSNNCAMELLANNSSMPRSFYRENSFKNAETAKVKFLPTHTAASLCSGMALRESLKTTGVDGNTDAALPRTGINPRQISSRGSSIPMTDSEGPSASRSGNRSSLHPALAYSFLQSAGLSKPGDAFPSFLLSSRSNILSRVNSALRSSRESSSGNGQLGLDGSSSGTAGHTRSNSSRINAAGSSNYSNDLKTIAPRNDEMKRKSKHSSGTAPVSNLLVEKSNADIYAPLVVKSGSSEPDESMGFSKGNLHLPSSLAEKCSAQPSEVVQQLKLISAEQKGLEVVKQSPLVLISSQKVVKDLVSTEHAMKKNANMSELSDMENENHLIASVSVEDDRVLTPSVVSTRMTLLTEEKAVLDVLKDRLPKVDSSLVIEETEMLTLSKQDCKTPNSTTLEDEVTIILEENPQVSVSNRKFTPSSLDEQTNAEQGPKTSTTISLDKDRENDFSSTLHDNTSSFRMKSAPVSLVNDSNLFEASQISAALLLTRHNTFAEMVPKGNSCKMEVKPTLMVIDMGSSDSSTYISKEEHTKLIDGSSKDPFSPEESLEKAILPTSIPHNFGRERLVATQSDNSMNQPSEINASASALVQTHIHSPSKRTSISSYSLKNHDMGLPLTALFGSTQQKLPTWPESLFLWRGDFEIKNKISGYEIYDGIQAHPSNKASPKVYEVSRKFPSQLLLEQVQCCDAWPKRFQESPPTDEDIALYIFPVEIERCQIQYFDLLETTIQQDLALRAYLECAELLIFSSNQLPECYHRYNGQMYLWGVFRGGKKIPLADPQRQLPDSNNAGSKVMQPSPVALLTKNNNRSPRQMTSINSSGCSEGEEDMDVDMEGGRELGIKERPTPRPQSQLANVIESNFMQTSKAILSHHENLKSGTWMQFEKEGLSTTGPVQILAKIPQGEEDMDVDMEGGREIGMAERPTARSESQLANLVESNTMQTFILPKSEPILNYNENSKSSGCLPFEQGGLSSIASESGSTKILGKIPEHFPRTSYVKDAERTNEQSITYDTNNELEFPPGFELPPVFHHSRAISRNNSVKHIIAMPENRDSFGVHAKLQRELLPSLGLPKDNMSDKNFQTGFSSQGYNCPPSTISEYDEYPPGFVPASTKPLVSFPEYPPGLEPASMKLLVSLPECPPGLEPSCLKPLLSSPDCPPGLGSTCMKSMVSSAESPPRIEAVSVKPLVTYADCPPFLEPADGNPLFSMHCSSATDTFNRMPALSSECPSGFKPAFENCPPTSLDHPPGFESPAGKSLLPSSNHLIENLASKQLKGKPDLRVQSKVEPSCQHSAYLPSEKDVNGRYNSKIHHANGSRGVTRSHSLAYITREVDRGRNVARMPKSKSFKEELYSMRSKREKEDRRERSRSRSREKERNWKRSGSSNREKEDIGGRYRNYSREKEVKKERDINHSRGKEGERERDRNHSREEQDLRKWGRKYTERKNGRDRDKGYHRDWSRYSGTTRHKDYGKHSHKISYYSHRESPTQSYSASEGKCRTSFTRKVVSSHHANSSYSDSSIDHHIYNKSSLEKDSENGEKSITLRLHKGIAITDNVSAPVPRSELSQLLEKDSENGEKAVTGKHHKGKAIKDNGSAQVPRSEHCSPEVIERSGIIEAGKMVEDNDCNLLCDLNEAISDCEITYQENLGGKVSQNPTQVNTPEPLISRTNYTFLHSGQSEQHVMPVESNWPATSSPTIHDSVQCLQLFPIDGTLGVTENIANDWDFNLELGLGRQTTNKEPFPLLEQSSLQINSSTIMLDNGASTSTSKSVCDDSRQASPAIASILSLSMPRYRKQGNTWVEVTKDSKISEEMDADVKLTLSMSWKD